MEMEVESLKLFDKESKRAIRRFLTRAERLGFPRSTENFMGALDSIFQTELNNRQHRLAIMLEREEDIKEKFRRKEEKHHERSIQRINETQKIFKAERKIIKAKYLKQMDEIIKDKETFGKIRDKSIETLQNTFLESSVDPNNAMEVLEIFSDVFNKIENKREINGLFDYIEEQLEELKRVRSEEKDRGRENHSPLPWHKILALGAWLGLSIGTVIVCWIYSWGNWLNFSYCMIGALSLTAATIAVIKAILLWC